MSTKIELGKGNAYIVKTKSKYKPVKTGYCNNWTCLSEVQVNDENKCMRCGSPVIRHFRYDATKKRFDAFLEKNADILNAFLFDKPENENLKVPIMFNKSIHYVPLRYFIEYQNITGTEEYTINKNNAFQHFFDYIKSVTQSSKF